MTMTTDWQSPMVAGHAPSSARTWSQLRLVAVPTAVACAGCFVRCTLQDWGIESAEIEAAGLRVVELATAAVQPTAVRAQLPVMVIRILCFDRIVVIEIADDDPHPPAHLEPEDRWTYCRPVNGGKVTGFELALPPRLAHDDTVELAWPQLPDAFHASIGAVDARKL